jgi:hypothetical protein
VQRILEKLEIVQKSTGLRVFLVDNRRGESKYAAVQHHLAAPEEYMMATTLEQERRLRDLFNAHYTISELVERTGLPIDVVLRVLNAPRVQKLRSAA